MIFYGHSNKQFDILNKLHASIFQNRSDIEALQVTFPKTAIYK